MKKLFFLAVTMMVMVALVGVSSLHASNVTIWDKMGGLNEDQEVEPGCVWDQKWDLEAFVQKDGNLCIIGGFDFQNGEENWKTGHLFIKTSELPPIYGPTATGTGGDSGVTNNTFGYDLVLVWDFSNNTYNLYELNGASVVKVWYAQNDESNPWAYDSGGTLKEGNVTFTYTAGLTDTQISSNYDVTLAGGAHNVICLDMADLLPYLGNHHWYHITMECGNDNLMGYDPVVVPLPPSVLFLGTGFLGLGLLGWRRKKS